MANYCVDVNGEYLKAKSKIFRYSLLFSILLTLVIVGDVLLVTFASEDYLLNLIIACVITVLFIWFAIYFISNVFGDIDARYRYFKGYQSGIQSVDEIIFIKQSDELCFVNGLYVYPLHVKYVSNFTEQERIIYTLEKDCGYALNDKLTIVTYQRILLKAEKHS